MDIIEQIDIFLIDETYVKPIRKDDRKTSKRKTYDFKKRIGDKAGNIHKGGVKKSFR